MKPPRPAPNTSPVRVLGLRIDPLPLNSVLTQTESLLDSNKPHYLLTANALMIMLARSSPSYKSSLEKAALSIPDSSGITWATRFLNETNVERIPGIDLALHLCAQARKKNFPVYFLGAKPGIADRAAAYIMNKYPGIRIAGTRNGFFKTADEQNILDEIRSSGAKLIFLALGIPRQEEWFSKNEYRLPGGLYIGVGGTFDVWAGDLKRAPPWFQKRGLEWLYRVAQEPFRLKRIAKLPLFACCVVGERLKNGKKVPQNQGEM